MRARYRAAPSPEMILLFYKSKLDYIILDKKVNFLLDISFGQGDRT